MFSSSLQIGTTTETVIVWLLARGRSGGAEFTRASRGGEWQFPAEKRWHDGTRSVPTTYDNLAGLPQPPRMTISESGLRRRRARSRFCTSSVVPGGTAAG